MSQEEPAMQRKASEISDEVLDELLGGLDPAEVSHSLTLMDQVRTRVAERHAGGNGTASVPGIGYRLRQHMKRTPPQDGSGRPRSHKIVSSEAPPAWSVRAAASGEALPSSSWL